MKLKDRMDLRGIFILLVLFIIFYFVTSLVLDNMKHDEVIENNNPATEVVNPDDGVSRDIVNNLYQDAKILYDVVNSKFKVDQEDLIVVNNITYKRITNFDDVVNGLFTKSGINKYVSDLGSYFAIIDDKYYLAGNLVSYQTYYFRGDTTNIYILDTKENEINAIIYERWTSNNKNTLATIKVVMENGTWLIDNISILSNE